jgi:glycosyltransferase involved in cell wall biosynthesis
MSERARVLFFVHGHPALRPGGAEQASLELYEAMRNGDEFEPFLAARTDDPNLVRPGTTFGAVNDDPNQLLYFSRFDGDDFFLGTRADKDFYTTYLRRLLETVRPSVVHFQHTVHTGLESIRLVRATLPGVPIVYTLHEYLPICTANGQMVRTFNLETCMEASPRRCNECFPSIEPGRFLLRERFIKAQLALVDRFVAPSRFLLERYVDWGVDRERLVEIDYGRAPTPKLAPRELRRGEGRSQFGFFGQLNPYKGIRELLAAMRVLRESGREDLHLYVNGANLDVQPEEFRAEVDQLLTDTGANVTVLGSYARNELAARMELVDWVVVPSIWWENSPLVIQEAFLRGRPVICNGIGGMAEKVKHDVNGIHAQVRNPHELAHALARAADTDGLWERLHAGVPQVPTAERAARAHVELYRELIAQDLGQPVGQVA